MDLLDSRVETSQSPAWEWKSGMFYVNYYLFDPSALFPLWMIIKFSNLRRGCWGWTLMFRFHCQEIVTANEEPNKKYINSWFCIGLLVGLLKILLSFSTSSCVNKKRRRDWRNACQREKLWLWYVKSCLYRHAAVPSELTE